MPVQVSPSTLFFIEGCGQLGYAMCWGDGFVTDPGLIQQFGLTDPKPILNQILAAPYAKQVVISPHYYPPSISGQSTKWVSAICSALHNSPWSLTLQEQHRCTWNGRASRAWRCQSECSSGAPHHVLVTK